MLVDTNITTGILHVKCLRDFNGNRCFDPAHDVVYARPLTKLDNGRTLSFALGDYDYDGVCDSDELAEGTDPLRGNNYCFNLTTEFMGIFSTTNQLTAEVFFGTNRISGPFVMTSRTWSYGMEHLVASNHETAVVYFWEDVNANGLREPTEKTLTNRYSVAGHDMTVTNRLAYGAFDADGDGMLDSWELQHGLSPASAGDAALDADGDGFINLYEFWAGTDPNDPVDDGEGTALYELSHSIDDRIAIAVAAAFAKSNFLNYSRYQLPGILHANVSAWAAGIDFSSTSIWNDSDDYHYGDPATLLSPQHVILATHLRSPIGRCYTFQDMGGCRATRTLVATQGIAQTDITIGLLDSSLPQSFVPVKLLPSDYERNLGTCQHIPVLHMDQERKSIVQELPSLPRHSRRYFEICCNRGSTAKRLEFYEPVVGGDSGSPCFLIAGNQRILLYAVQGNQGNNFYASKGYHTLLFRNKIQALMNVMSDDNMTSRYSLQFFDFSGYTPLEEW